MDELITEGYKTLVALMNSHVEISLKLELKSKLLSILMDERFLKGEEHSATRHTVCGKVIHIDYSAKGLKDLIENINKLLGKNE